LLLFSPFYRSANVLFHLFPRKPVNHVMNQSKQQILSFIVCRGEHGQDQDWISCRILAIFQIRIVFGYSFLKNKWSRTGSGYWFDFYNEILMRVIRDVTNDGDSVFFARFFILSVCAALITISGNSCYFIVNFSGQVEVVSCSYIAGMLLCLLC